MINSHDVFADVFDIIYESFGNREYTLDELAFIRSQLPPKGFVLDLGCGTGRHVIPLAKAGFHMTGIDQSQKLLDVLHKKLVHEGLSADLLCRNVLRMKKADCLFDGVICFWSSFCEMARTYQQAVQIFTFIYNNLQHGGVFLLEESNLSHFDPANLEFHTALNKGGKSYESTYHVLCYTPRTRTSISEQRVRIYSRHKLLKTLTSHIVQRWWTLKELAALCNEAGFRDITFYGGNFAPFEESTDKIILVAKK